MPNLPGDCYVKPSKPHATAPAQVAMALKYPSEALMQPASRCLQSLVGLLYQDILSNLCNAISTSIHLCGPS